MPESRAIQSAMVHLVDDDAAVRESLLMLLEANGLAVQIYPSAAALLAVAAGLKSGCVITDVRMPDMDGLAMQRELAARHVTLPVIVMTGHGDVPIAVEAMKAGAADFLEKPFDEARLLGAIRGALEADAQAKRTAAAAAGLVTRFTTLTRREREVMDRLVAGHPNKTIAFDLGSSPRTVEVHRARIMEKMAAQNLPDLVRMSIALENRAIC